MAPVHPSRSFGVFFPIILLLLAPGPGSDAAVFHLMDGTELRGAYIGEADGVITLLDEEGKKRTVERDQVQWIDTRHPDSPRWQRKIERERKRFLDERRKEAETRVKAYGRAAPEERPSLERELDRFQEAELYPALARALSSPQPEVRELAFRRLKAFRSPGAVVPFVRETLVRSLEDEYAARCHRTAVDLNEAVTRQVYEYVAAVGYPEERLRSLDYISRLGSRDSVPGLILVLQTVHAEIIVQQSRLKGIREVPANLGGGATRVPIELPEIELIQVAVSTRIPVAKLEGIRGAAVSALEKISGEQFGSDIARWQRWWKKQ